MFVITVIPIQRGIGKENLTYFTASTVELGSLVKVPLRKKTIDALVISIDDVRSKKMDIKSSSFTLRKLDRITSKPFLSEAFMETVNEVAEYHAATTGSVLNVLLPKKLLSEGINFSQNRNVLTKLTNLTMGTIVSTTLNAPLKERIEKYKKEITKLTKLTMGTIVSTQSTMVPIVNTVKKVVIIVPTKIQETLFKKEFISMKDHVSIILPSSLITILPDTSLIIIDDAEPHLYKGISRPFLDFRYALKTYAQKIGAEVLEGYTSSTTSVKKYIEEHKKEDTKSYTSLGTYLEQDILGLKKHAGHIFILGTRVGHSGTVLCQDCGSTLMCPHCNSPYTLHLKKNTEEYNNFLCHHCGFKESAARKCESCGGWRLKAFGLGIEKIEEDLKTFLKKNKIETYLQRIDSTLKLTPKKIKEFVKTHYEKEHSILIGTEILLPYLIAESLENNTNDASYIASLDTLLSLPDFSINDKIWRLFSQLGEITRLRVIVQTKNAKNPLLTSWQQGSDKAFRSQEDRDKKTFNYPPYGVFVKISVKGRKEKVGQEMALIQQQLIKWKPTVFPAFIKTINNQHILHALITLPASQWPDRELLNFLLSLPPSVTVDINPRSLL